MNDLSPASLLFPIDHGIPIPPPKGPRARKYPFRDLEVGDSVFIPGKTSEDLKGSLRHARCACRAFATRRVTEHGVTGLRVWRTA